MTEREQVSVSVRSLVEFVLADGDITPIAPRADRFREGTQAHRVLQADREPEFQAEVPMSLEVTGDSVVLTITGRADGVLRTSHGLVVEEIKTTNTSVADIEEDDYPVHWAQAEAYAAILAEKEDLSSATMRLIYYHLRSGESRVFERSRSRAELADRLSFLTGVYLEWCESLSMWSTERTRSLSTLQFPFPEFRLGQREMAVAVFRAMREPGELFIQAPTGIGKTMAVVFSAVKALKEDHISRIFYLTAKNTTQPIVEESLSLLRDAGMRLKSVTITAKSRICFLKDRYPDNPPCDPVICRYARGYYGRIRQALKEIHTVDVFTRPVIEGLAEKHTVCPFEYSLDLALWSELVICDYNYAFDPRVQLQRFFVLRKGAYGFLVDEAHNLPDRAREMFSAQIDKTTVLRVRRAIREEEPELYKALSDVNRELLGLRKEILPDQARARPEPPYELGERLKVFVAACEKRFRRRAGILESLVGLYYEAHSFVRVLGTFDERFVTLLETARGGLRVKLACVDPSVLIRKTLDRGKSAIFFSATMTPMSYHVDLLGGTEDSDLLVLPSPFPRENLCVLVDPSISTRFRDRDRSYEGIAARIIAVVSARPGNYMTFFPSYAYLGAVLGRLEEIRDGSIEIAVQQSRMSEEERKAFLARFDGARPAAWGSLVGFVVMGGIFGEGIDLLGDRLTGAIVVGVGLPMISRDRDIIREYYDRVGQSGFAYAYMYPGLNRVLQACGRVIRSEKDRGAVLLIDDRFDQSHYRGLFPDEWNPIPYVRGIEEISDHLESFWRDP